MYIVRNKLKSLFQKYYISLKIFSRKNKEQEWDSKKNQHSVHTHDADPLLPYIVYPHFYKWGNKAQRGLVIFPKPNSSWVAEPGFELSLFTFKAEALIITQLNKYLSLSNYTATEGFLGTFLKKSEEIKIAMLMHSTKIFWTTTTCLALFGFNSG